ncbi:MAG TPA: response regulator [Verrucomicrobiae bacterium]|nr:response regulator [Verrucomicrobiae bacterium]
MDDEGNAVHLLLVEDSPADVYLVREAMKTEGLECRLQVAEDGEMAIQILNRVDAETDPAPNLLLVDLNVPRRDGIQVLQRMRQSPRYAGIPVIVISSSDSQADRERALAMGATEYFRKPSTLDEFMKLGRLVRTLHSRSGLRHEGGLVSTV